ncbi:MAG: hypothetical protein IKI23_13295 [Lachnospiraceae bacterium]|nr:hypothetical protein [Lachnospiraceae bacterium]
MTEQAMQIWSLAIEEVLLAYHFLVNATGHFSFVWTSGAGSPLTDGQRIYMDEEALIRAFARDRDWPAHALLHMLLHCMFGHPFRRKVQEGDLWDRACDIAVEKVISDLAREREEESFLSVSGEVREALFRIENRAGVMTAEGIYNACMDDPRVREDVERLSPLFFMDDHSLWRNRDAAGRRKVKRGLLLPNPEDGKEESESGEPGMTAEDLEDLIDERAFRNAEKKWRNEARKVQMELDNFQNRFGSRAGRFADQLGSILWEEIDYGEFLRNFGAVQETLKISDDAFDIAYYKYGLEIYGNIPLIEPLEFAEEKRIRTFVIAIDTSGSVQGEIVQSFLQKTVDVLRSTGSFTRMVDILLIQCDAQIQTMERITDMDQLEDLIPRLVLRGFGGTDFRPVFDFVDRRIREGKMEMPDGLLYFTDGVGAYPEKAPEYKTAFIFNRDDHISPNVPSWAIRAVLSTDSIRLLKKNELE